LQSAKRAVNLSVSPELLDAGRTARINLSALLERALTEELAHLRRLQWREGNARAIDAYNRHFERYGTCFEGSWSH